MKKIVLILCFLYPSLMAYAAEQGGEKRMFTVTGYYSPLPNQSFYVTGGYKSEIRLNGRGIAGADGTPVFAGMIAAPSTYTFGTKICLPGFGCGEVRDRGGAIVNKGERNLAKHDRLDLWMGAGEEGLARALALGVWQTEGVIYESSRSDIIIAVNFKSAAPISKLLDMPIVRKYAKNLSLGDKGEAVKVLQEDLSILGFYKGELDSYYSEELSTSILEFQLKKLVLENSDSLGAGVFGPQTQEALSDVIYQFEAQQRAFERWGKFSFDKNFSKGKRDILVWKLQEMLVSKEFLDHRPTGYFGKLTEKALIEFQISEDIINTSRQAGAGNVGPTTRERLNVLLEEENRLFALDRKTLAQVQESRQKLRFLAGKGIYLIVKK